uniref:RING-type domain-containing protein n=1 Tax=Panagrellus redivivus TaxID=6233 RepID=A0A7E4VU97_PANRE
MDPFTTCETHSKCSICYYKYNRTHRTPLSMNCGHTFCRTCVRQLSTAKLFSCPVCRAVSLIGWHRVQKNSVLLSIFEALNLLDDDDSNEYFDDTPPVMIIPDHFDHENVSEDDILQYFSDYLHIIDKLTYLDYVTLDDRVRALYMPVEFEQPSDDSYDSHENSFNSDSDYGGAPVGNQHGLALAFDGDDEMEDEDDSNLD